MAALVVNDVREIGCSQSTFPALEGFGDSRIVGPGRIFFLPRARD